MKRVMLLVAIMSATSGYAANADNIADLEYGVVYQVSDGKAYKVVDGLVSNEWIPLTPDGYEYSEKALIIKAANDSLRKIRQGG